MKKSDIEKNLKNDLNAFAPSDFNAVWNKCVTSEEEKEIVAEPILVDANIGQSQKNYRKHLPHLLFAVSMMCCCCCIIILCMTLMGKVGGLVLPSGSGYFTIDVNPSIQVNYDNSGIITSAEGLNSDGVELLSELELDGKTYDLAVAEIFERFVSLGYFSASSDDNAILMTASQANGEKDEQMTAEINKCFLKAFEDKKITGTVISDVDNSKYQKEGEKYGINGQKYELILRYIEMGGSLEESKYQTITIKELYSYISNADKASKDK